MVEGAETRFAIPIKGNSLFLLNMLVTCTTFLHLAFDEGNEKFDPCREMRM